MTDIKAPKHASSTFKLFEIAGYYVWDVRWIRIIRYSIYIAQTKPEVP